MSKSSESNEAFPDFNKLLQISRLAGSVVKHGFDSLPCIEVESKSDGTPVTWVDLASDGVLLRLLRHEFAEVPVYSEESESSAEPFDLPRYWIVDPLDATKEFAKGNAGHFCVTFALIEASPFGYQPTIGVVHDPVKDETWLAKRNAGAWHVSRSGVLKCEASLASGQMKLIENASSRNSLVSRLKNDLEIIDDDVIPQGSALKCRVLLNCPGSFYARPTPQKEWDIAALALICSEAGLAVSDIEGKELTFNNDHRQISKGLLISKQSIVSTLLLRIKHLLQEPDHDKFLDISI